VISQAFYSVDHHPGSHAPNDTCSLIQLGARRGVLIAELAYLLLSIISPQNQSNAKGK
jgi:hypothetical protein